ncbi:MAG: type III-A CRISPR-associated RAMP protein Csm5 [Syntrophaceae bacterium CG2_30_58_14]|nr:MAG: type III-A CRISPR-associated RAMP protein Csm5 [Syntrophaceae bacterium CG2_30_58_14]
MKDPNLFSIRVLSPVHIGCDEVYEPMSFVIDENAGRLISFDPQTFIRGLGEGDKRNFSEICRKGTLESLLELYKFMRGRNVPGHAVNICPGLVDDYRRTLRLSVTDGRKIQQELNNFSIARTAFNLYTQLPYLPGSAIKGAFRTAYLDRQSQSRSGAAGRQVDGGPTRVSGREAKELEKTLLDGGSFETDPFRMLKISDFIPAGPVKTRVVYAVNEKKVPSKFKARGPYQILEVIEPGAVFVGTIGIIEPEKTAGIKNPLRRETLFDSVAGFYTREKRREDDELREIDVSPIDGHLAGMLALARIGRHSGAESVTIEGHRRIRIMKGKGERPGTSDHATTFWLASDASKSYAKTQLRPFGWVVIGDADALRIDLPAEQPSVESLTEADMAKDQAPQPVLEPQTMAAIPAPEQSALVKLLDELRIIAGTDAGRIGTVIQKIEKLESHADRAAAATAVRDKIGPKAFKKHKRKEYIEGLIATGTEVV